MADEQEHTNMNSLVEPDPSTGLNIVLNASTNRNNSNKPISLAEADSNSVPKLNSNPFVNTKPTSQADPKRVSIAETNEDEGGLDGNRNIAIAEAEDDEAKLDQDIVGSDMPMGLGEKKKKRNKRKPKSQRGLGNPTGFEDYYVDPPITPDEYEEERNMYDISLPFAQRIEKAIQRFLAKRNLDSTRKNLFTKYLIHGGIEAGPNMFSGGLDADTLETRNAAEIAELRATTFVGSDKIDIGKSDHVVDFEGCLGSFLSHMLPAEFELHSEDKIKYFIGIIRNFFNYLLYHDVCPDYNDQVQAARTLCDKAEKELWAITPCNSMLPGDFNKSCSEIFGGMYQGMWSQNQEWVQGVNVDYDIGISPHHARKVFKYALAAAADDYTHKTYAQQLKANSTRITSVSDNTGFEVTDILPPTQEVLDFYSQPEAAGLKPIGRIRAKSWVVPTAAEEDLTEEEEAELATKTPEVKHYEFWVENEILSHCVVGMKIEATVTELSFGVSYFDAVCGVHCSFYQLLPNELMAGWRTPEKEWLPMRKSTRGADNKNADFDDLPDDDAEEDEMPDGKLEDATHEEETKENRIHGIESSGSCGLNGGINTMQTSDVAVNVRQTGERLIQVPGNAEKVLEKTFDVEPKSND